MSRFLLVFLLVTSCAAAKPKVDPLWYWESSEVPLLVIMHEDVDAAFGKEVRDAVDWWNAKVGKTVFTLTSLHMDSGLVIIMPFENATLFMGRASKPGLFGAVYVKMVQTFPHRTIRHELGHILGLPHYDDVNDVMWPVIESGDYDVAEFQLEYLREAW